MVLTFWFGYYCGICLYYPRYEYYFIMFISISNSVISKIKCYKHKIFAYKGKIDFRIKGYQLRMKLQHTNFSCQRYP